jgi:hypothetical protein
MKEWARAHPNLALAAGYVVFFVFVTAVWWVFASHDLENALVTAFVWTLAYFLFAIFQTRRKRESTARLEEHRQFLAYIRYPDFRPGSLSSIWNQGIATPSTGSIHFQPAVYDTLEPSGRATTINVQELLPDRRKITGNDRKYLPAYGLQAMTLMTDNGKVEIAARPESLDKLCEVLGFR